MIAGHYAAALAVKGRYRRVPLLWLLILSQLTDYLFIFFSVIGWEPVEKSPGPMGFVVEMTFSHDLVPVLIQIGAFTALTALIFRRRDAVTAAFLALASHPLLDFFSGFPHHIMGEGTAAYGLGNYLSNPVQAFLIELAFTLFFLFFFFRTGGRERSPKVKVIVSTALLLPTLLTIGTVLLPFSLV